MITALLAATVVASSTAPPPPLVNTRLRSVALFKNGYAFSVREGACPVVKAVDVAPLPMAAYGTFWLAADPRKLGIVEAVASRETWTEEAPALSIDDILRANVGRRLLVGGQPMKILRILEPAPSSSESGQPSYGREGLLIVETPTGEQAMPRGLTQAVSSTDGPLNDQVERRGERLRLRVELDPHGSGTSPLFISYLSGGASWAPSYVVDISDPARARMTAKAEVFSEVEDLEDTDVRFVTGFPNVGFRAIASPISMQGKLSDFVSALYREEERLGGDSLPINGRNFAQMAEQLSVTFPTVGVPAMGEGKEDLFFYERKGVTLKHGERAYFPLFTASVPYEHLYEWSVPDTLPEPSAYGRQETARREVIWHSIRLTNEGATPWTTAAAMTLKDDRMLGQDVLRYTPPGGTNALRITQAVDLEPEQAEVETARQRDAAVIGGYHYDLVTVRGEFRITNHKKERVTVEITKMLSGEMVETPPGADVTSLARGLRKVNPTVRMLLKVPIDAGASASVPYVYKLYVHN